MPESSLAAPWDELRQRVAFDRGYNSDKAQWTAEQKTILEMVVRSAARLFYTPPPNGEPPHEWTFLRPNFELIIPADQDDIDLPADFGFLVGDLYFLDPTTSWAVPLQRKNSAMIMKFRQHAPLIKSRPEYCATVPKGPPGVLKGQRQMLMVYPVPVQDYAMQGRYSVLPEALDPSHPYPYGGAAHSETLVQACLAASEQLNGTPGPHTQHFRECLAASIEYDRRVGATSIDNQDGRRFQRMGQDWRRDGLTYPFLSVATYNGMHN
jgi:hypothetical protein